MNRSTQFCFFMILGISCLVSCEQEQGSARVRVCDNEYFYYSNLGSKIILKQSLTEIWIVFDVEGITKESAESILGKYSFIDFNSLSNDYTQVGVKIKEDLADCASINNYLELLNQDEEIRSATPVFYLSANDPDSYVILLSEVSAKNMESLISEADFIAYAESMNLELTDTKYGTQYFKIKNTVTGFEALELANEIYETGKVVYAQPNCIVKYVRF